MGEEALISTADSKIKVFAIPTNEELMSKDTYAFVKFQIKNVGSGILYRIPLLN